MRTTKNKNILLINGFGSPGLTPAEFSASCIASASPTAQLQQYTTDKTGNSLIKVGT